MTREPSLRRAGATCMWLTPGLVAFVIVVLPVAFAVAASFFKYRGNSLSFVGLDAYGRLMTSPQLEAVGDILLRAIVVATVCQVLALPVGYFIARRSSGKVRLVLIGMLLSPFFTSDALRAFAWSRILAADSIVCRSVAAVSFGWIGANGFRFSGFALDAVLCSTLVPFGILTVIASMPRTGDAVWLASAELGRSESWTFWHVGVPTAASGAIVGWLLVAVLAFYSSVEECYVGNSTNLRLISGELLNTDVGDV